MLKRAFIIAGATVAASFFSFSAQSAIVPIDNLTDFNQRGTFMTGTDFEEFEKNRYHFPSTFTAGQSKPWSWSTSGITFDHFGIIIGAATSDPTGTIHDPLSNVFTAEFTTVSGYFDPLLDPIHSFGFDLSVVNRNSLSRSSDSDITVSFYTNKSDYTFNLSANDIPHAAFGGNFFGFSSNDVTEFLTGFSITPLLTDIAPTIDNLVLRSGVNSPVQSNNDPSQLASIPEPFAASLLVFGMAFCARRRVG